jgi:hypothetical protein
MDAGSQPNEAAGRIIIFKHFTGDGNAKRSELEGGKHFPNLDVRYKKCSLLCQEQRSGIPL